MNIEKDIIIMTFGAIIAIVGIILLFRNTKEQKQTSQNEKDVSRNHLEVLGLTMDMSSPGLAIFLVGCAIFIVPLFFPINGTSTSVIVTPKPFKYSKSELSTSQHQLKLLYLSAKGKQYPVKVGDILRIEFTLKNLNTNPIQFEETFVAARNLQRTNKDFGYSNQNIILKEGETIAVSVQKKLKSSGTWKFWSCYTIVTTDADNKYCPDEWEFFLVEVEE